MLFRAEPLLHKNRDKESGQSEFHALVVDGQKCAGEDSKQSSADPIDVVKEGDPETVTAVAETFRDLILGNKRVGFIGQTENQICFAYADMPIAIQHRNAVKQMPCVDHQRRQRHGQQGRTPGQ